MSKVLITGVAGLIGSHFSRYLLDQGHDVVGIDNLSGGYREYVDPRLLQSNTFHQVDLLDVNKVAAIFQAEAFEYVYHFAAYAAEGLSPFIRHYNYSNNLLCSVNIINNAINFGVKKVIFTSSMAVYGAGQTPFSEEQTPQPVDPYGIAKFAVEMDLHQAADQFGLAYTIVRPHNVIGIYQNIWDKYRNVIGIWIRRVISGESILIFGDGKQKRAFSDIKFYLDPMAQLMSGHDNQVYNLGSDQEYELNEVAELVKTVAQQKGYDPVIEHGEFRHEVKDAFCSHEKAKRELNFHDDTHLIETIQEMFDWAVTQPSRDIKYMPYEITKQMYSFWK